MAEQMHPPPRASQQRSTGRLSRRAMLAGTVGATAAIGLGAAGCTPGDAGESGGNGERGGAKAVLPNYVPYTGVEPTYPAEVARTSAAFAEYPAEPPRYAENPPGNGQPVTFMGPTSFAMPPVLADNPFWQEMNARAGSPLDIQLTPAGEYDAKFATSVAGGQLPDMFYVGSMASLPEFLAADAADLTDHLSGDAINDYPALANIPSDAWRGCMFGGRIRTLPLHRGLISLPSILVREDLLAGQGMSVTDVDSFETLYSMSKELTGGDQVAWTNVPLGYIRSMLDIPQTWTLDEDGRLGTSLEDERHEQALEAARRLVADKVVVPDYASTPTANRKLAFGSGTRIFHPDSFIAWFSLYVQHERVPGIEIQVLPMAGFDGGQGTQALSSGIGGRSAINIKAGDRIADLLRIADWLAAPVGTEEYLFNKYGIAGRHYNLDGTDPIPTEQNHEVNIGSLYLCDAARAIYSPGRPDTVRSAWEHQQSVTGKAMADPTYGLYSETGARKLPTLDRKLSDTVDSIIAGRQPVSAWQGAVQTFLNDGATTVLEEYQADLDANPPE
ncbi:hypothetical protein [Microlunatus sp. Y2014]|uniref:hypothetical protein n=1 Tax=Microlunatus sp. Y2014 TaxID=3418488 RepID=UPI003DA73FC8